MILLSYFNMVSIFFWDLGISIRFRKIENRNLILLSTKPDELYYKLNWNITQIIRFIWFGLKKNKILKKNINYN